MQNSSNLANISFVPYKKYQPGWIVSPVSIGFTSRFPYIFDPFVLQWYHLVLAPAGLLPCTFLKGISTQRTFISIPREEIRALVF